MLSTIFKTALNSTIKSIDGNTDAFINAIANELQIKPDALKKAFINNMLIFSNVPQKDIEKEKKKVENEEKKRQKELEKEEPQNEESNDIKPNERIMDPVRLFEQFKPSLNVAENKKSDILKGMIQYKTAQKLMERQEIQREIDKVAIELKVMRQEYLGMIDIVRKDLKEVRESFLMAMLIILHNFSFIPLDKLPIFKNQKK